ncbi:MAG: hypothetical protein GC161_10800 [Planctomycetaceae bacterium]|nr:hypothetical protein [Planctomycetaceae bacterium]
MRRFSRRMPAFLAATAAVLALSHAALFGFASGTAQEAGAAAAPSVGGPITISKEALGRVFELVGKPAPAEPLVIPESDVQLALVHTLGSQELEARKIDVFLEREINARVRQGADRSEFAVDDAAVEAQIEQMREQVRQQYPTLDVDFVLTSNGIQPGSLRSLTQQSQLFNQVFLPDNPAEWPPMTRDAIVASMGEEVVSHFQAAYERRVAEGAPQDAAGAQGQALFKRIMRDAVVRALDEQSEVRTAGQGLPEGVALRVDDVDIRTADVYATIADRVTPEDLRKARLWAQKTALLEAVFQAAGTYPDDATFDAAFDAHEAPFKNNPINLNFLARQVKRFPSLDHYREHFRLQAAFEKLRADELDRAAMEDHLARAQRYLGLEVADVEIILLSAYDFPTGKWKENGWKEAEQRAKEVVAALVEAGGENWSELLQAHSDFWDPPLPPAAAQQAPARSNQGRFGPKNRNELAQSLGESDFSMFLEGGSVTDALFFDVPTGELGGPWRGPYGYYIGLVKARTPAKQLITLDGGNYEDMVRQDMISVRFNAFAQEVLRRAGLG